MNYAATLQKILYQFFKDLTSLGSALVYVLLVVIVFLFGFIPLALQLLLGLVITGAVIVLIRLFYFKPRPRRQEQHNFIERIDAAAFPSWHAARIVFLAISFSMLLQNNYFTILATILAALVSYSRIYLQKHDGWDVLGGIGLGIITYWMTTMFL